MPAEETELVTVYSFPDTTETEKVCSVLERKGIRCHRNNEAINQLYPAAFPTQVEVRAKDAERARQIIEEYFRKKPHKKYTLADWIPAIVLLAALVLLFALMFYSKFIR